MNDSMLYDVRGVAHPPLPADAVRLVSLVPSTTETLFALGRGADVVGYTRFCKYPADQLTQAKWIGGTKNPKLDKIIALAPDLVLANREENRPEDIAALEAAGVRVWVAEPRTVAETITEIVTMGRVIGCATEGERLAAELRALQLPPPAGDLLRVAYLIWRNPYMVAGDDTFVSDMLAQGGFANAFVGRYPEVSIEELRSVDLVLLSSEPFPFAAKHRAELIELGIPERNLRFIDGELISWHGVRLREGLPYVSRLRGSLMAMPSVNPAKNY